ncbi:MAG: FHA domain-containing protein, partial [Wenzhouxiangellaceae bacterium]
MPLERFLEFTDAARGMTSRYPLRDFPSVIGRAADAQVQLTFESVSRRHAEIGRNNGGRLTIRDLGSTNGTFVNGTRIDRIEALLAGDVIHIGDIELRLAETVNTLPPDDDAATRMGLNISAHSPIPVREFAELLDQELVTGYRQPIVGRDGRTIGFELLGRGTHPSLSAAPGELFGLAEMAQQEARLSRLMRRRCFDEAARAR